MERLTTFTRKYAFFIIFFPCIVLDWVKYYCSVVCLKSWRSKFLTKFWPSSHPPGPPPLLQDHYLQIHTILCITRSYPSPLSPPGYWFQRLKLFSPSWTSSPRPSRSSTASSSVSPSSWRRAVWTGRARPSPQTSYCPYSFIWSLCAIFQTGMGICSTSINSTSPPSAWRNLRKSCDHTVESCDHPWLCHVTYLRLSYSLFRAYLEKIGEWVWSNSTKFTEEFAQYFAINFHNNN